MSRVGLSTSLVGIVLIGVVGSIGGWVLRGTLDTDPSRSLQLQTKPQSHPQTLPPKRALAASGDATEGYYFAPGIQSQFSRQLALFTQAQARTAPQLQQLIDQASGTIAGNDYAVATQILYRAMAEIDPKAALQSIEHSDYFRKSIWYDVVFRAFGFKDIEAALTEAKRLPTQYRKSALKSALAGIEHEPYARQLRLGATVDINPRLQLSGRDPRDAWLDVRAIKNTDLRNQLAKNLLFNIAESDPSLALELTQELDEADRQPVLQTVVETWAGSDVIAAYQWIQRQPADDATYGYIRRTIGYLAEQDSDWMKAVIAQQPQHLRTELYGRAVKRMLRGDPDEAAAWLADLHAQGEYLAQYDSRSLGRRLSEQGLAFVERWRDRLPEELVAAALPSALAQASKQDPEKAAAYVSRITEPDIQAASAESVAAGYALVNPEAAAQWLTSLDMPAHYERQALFKLANVWVEQDSDAAVDYALQLEEPKSRDSLLGALASTNRLEAERMASLIDGVTDGIAKLQMAQSLYLRMAATDPSSAKTFRETYGLDRDGNPALSFLDDCFAQQLN